MTMQRLCHKAACAAFGCTILFAAGASRSEPAMHDYPTAARVEYVNECIARNGGKLAGLYQCSCVIDAIARRFTYEEFTEASTFSRYSTLPGEQGGVFRDPPRAKELVKAFRELEKSAHRECGLPEPE
jgi:hypothetical protein